MMSHFYKSEIQFDFLYQDQDLIIDLHIVAVVVV